MKRIIKSVQRFFRFGWVDVAIVILLLLTLLFLPSEHFLRPALNILLVGVFLGRTISHGNTELEEFFSRAGELDHSSSYGNRFYGVLKKIPRWLWLILLFGFAAALRFRGITFGLPNFFHPDEIRKMHVLNSMIARDSWDPQYFLHPTLLLYLTIVVSKMMGLAGAVFSAPGADLILSGRIVSALAGAGSVLVVYQLGKQLFSRFHAFCAALLFAVTPVAVTCSRYLKEDSLLTFFCLATTSLLLSGVKTKDPRFFYLAAIAVGLSGGTKYTGAVNAVFLLGAVLFTFKLSIRTFYLLVRLGTVVLFTFILCTPYAVITPENFVQGLTFRKKSSRSRAH